MDTVNRRQIEALEWMLEFTDALEELARDMR